MKRFLKFIPLMALIVFIGCSKDDDDNGSPSNNNEKPEFENGVSQDILDFVSPELLDKIENEFDIPIHRGENPPEVDRSLILENDGPNKKANEDTAYFMSPVILVETNVPDDEAEPGKRFADQFFRFKNQDREQLTLEVDVIHYSPSGDEVARSEGSSSYIIGEGNKFTVFSEIQHTTANGAEAKATTIWSGKINEDGIKDLIKGNVMIENHDHEEFIPNETGRSFKDDDGFTEVAEWPE